MLSVEEFARLSGISPRAVRHRAASGALRARKVGGRWVIEAEPGRARRSAGRRLSATSFDLLARYVDGERQDLDPDQRRRAKERLRTIREHGIAQVGHYAERPDLRIERFRASPEDVAELRSRSDLALTGISHPSAEVYGDVVDAYVSPAVRDELELFHLLIPADEGEADVVLRVQDPPPVVRTLHVIADLHDDPSSRSRAEAQRLLARVLERAE